MKSRIIEGIKKIIYWFPIIWKDRDYDHAYIEYMLEHKLKAMYNRFNDPSKTYVNWEEGEAAKSLKALKLCIMILERRREEFYIINLLPDDTKITTRYQRDISYDIEARDWKLLHKLLEKYMLYWWD